MGVTQVVGSPTVYEQERGLNLGRKANDTLRTLTLLGTIQDSIGLMDENPDRAREIIRENLNEILSEAGIQYKFSVEGRRPIYSTRWDDSEWERRFENAGERVAMDQVAPVPPEKNNVRVLAWAPEARENSFVGLMDELRPYWGIETIENGKREGNFRENIRKEDEDGSSYEFYDAVFIPDADADFNFQTLQNLDTFANHGRLVVGGSTLQSNPELHTMYSLFGLTELPTPQDASNYGNIEDLYLWHAEHSQDHPIVRSFVTSYKVDYAGENVYRYDYSDESLEGDGYDSTTATCLSTWGDAPESTRLHWEGVLVNDVDGDGDTTGPGTAVFFNMNFVQSAMTNDTGRRDWVRLAARAIDEGFTYEYRSIRLTLWRGEGVK